MKDGTIRLPFGSGRTSPVAARDVADVITEILANPSPHVGNTYHLTGPVSRDLSTMAAEFAKVLGRPPPPSVSVDIRDDQALKHGISNSGPPFD